MTDLAPMITAITQLGLAAAAWRLATALKVKVENHEDRIQTLEMAPLLKVVTTTVTTPATP